MTDNLHITVDEDGIHLPTPFDLVKEAWETRNKAILASNNISSSYTGTEEWLNLLDSIQKKDSKNLLFSIDEDVRSLTSSNKPILIKPLLSEESPVRIETHDQHTLLYVNEETDTVHINNNAEEVTIHDNIHCPKHYSQGGIETIEYIQAKLSSEAFKGYLQGNCMKYLSRSSLKNGVEDLKKCAVYLDWLIDVEETGKIK